MLTIFFSIENVYAGRWHDVDVLQLLFIRIARIHVKAHMNAILETRSEFLICFSCDRNHEPVFVCEGCDIFGRRTSLWLLFCERIKLLSSNMHLNIISIIWMWQFQLKILRKFMSSNKFVDCAHVLSVPSRICAENVARCVSGDDAHRKYKQANEVMGGRSIWVNCYCVEAVTFLRGRTLYVRLINW